MHYIKRYGVIQVKEDFPSRKLSSNSDFLNSSTIDILGWIILCCKGCPVHCRTFNSIPGLYPDNSTTTHPT